MSTNTKKCFKWSFATIVLVLVVVICFVAFSPRVHLQNTTSGSLSFSGLPPEFPLDKNGEQQIIKRKLSTQEVLKLSAIVSGKMLYRDNPSCGFDIDNAFILNDVKGTHLFCIAEDGDGILEDKSAGRFLYLSDAEMKEVLSIFSKYGGKLPYGI